ncbi:hypothetical protein LH392_04625 [Corynebacterium uberis]|uniref:hypothetical protein n=1 Tax=Corynebacterium uberis TaxID=2883169 RepID=UPI001D09E72A|nr:hypothetical protein [Corynebacterium uberis]UDL76580.1 hypothetical protein LH393_04215 [Corynebacterium uberis]UDL81071.1 hypothetical protein LH392_04625 [Corynebacterium uberis]
MVDPARPHEPQRHIFIRQDVSRAEVIGGITWLAVAAAVSVLLEVVYLSAWVSLPGGVQVPVPYTILLAGGFNLVLSRTALLWTRNKLAAGVPLWVWVAGFLTLTFWVMVTGDQLVGSSLRSLLLLVVGMAGGGWPLVRGK